MWHAKGKRMINYNLITLCDCRRMVRKFSFVRCNFFSSSAVYIVKKYLKVQDHKVRFPFKNAIIMQMRNDYDFIER